MNTERQLQIVSQDSHEETPFASGMQMLLEQPELITIETLLGLLTLAISPPQQGISRHTRTLATTVAATLLSDGDPQLEDYYQKALQFNSRANPAEVLDTYLHLYGERPLARQLLNRPSN